MDPCPTVIKSSSRQHLNEVSTLRFGPTDCVKRLYMASEKYVLVTEYETKTTLSETLKLHCGWMKLVIYKETSVNLI